MSNLKGKKYFRAVGEIALMDFRMKDQGTILGFFWTLLHPLVYFIVLHGIFVKWMGRHVSDFPLYLIIGIVQWNFFAAVTSNAITSIKSGQSLIKSIGFPRTALVHSSTVSVLMSHFLELVIIVLFFIMLGRVTSFKVLLILPILLLNVYLVSGISFVLATLGVYFLDIQRIWGIFTSIGLFITPIFYSLDLIAPEKRRLIELNPMTHIIQATRDILISDAYPAMGGLFYVFLLSSVFLAAGLTIFKLLEPYFVERI